MVRVGCLLVGIAAMAALPGFQLLTTSPSTASSPLSVTSSSLLTASSPMGAPQGEGRPARLGASGDVPDGVTVFDDEVPAVANLDDELVGALHRAATATRADGVQFHVNSGWRSTEYQAQLLREAIAEYGSEGEAARWVATPETSSHVAGEAVDIGPAYAAAWLSEHGAEHGLCQIYRNEPWHYELRPDAVDRGCPRMFADPTQDPRMQQ